jgi:hypothetical protein
MRATLWIALSALLATGSAYADTDPSTGRDAKVRTGDASVAAPAPAADVTVRDQGAMRSDEYDLSKVERTEARPQEKADAPAPGYPVTVDPNHPGGLFPWGG